MKSTVEMTNEERFCLVALFRKEMEQDWQYPDADVHGEALDELIREGWVEFAGERGHLLSDAGMDRWLSKRRAVLPTGKQQVYRVTCPNCGLLSLQARATYCSEKCCNEWKWFDVDPSPSVRYVMTKVAYTPGWVEVCGEYAQTLDSLLNAGRICRRAKRLPVERMGRAAYVDEYRLTGRGVRSMANWQSDDESLLEAS